MAIGKTKLFACKSFNWKGMNADIENCINNLHALILSKLNQFIHQDIPGKPAEVIGADIFTLNDKNYLCIADYYSKFPTVKRQRTCLQTA